MIVTQATLKQMCALLAAGGLGAGTTVAVQKVAAKPRPAVVKAAKPAPTPGAQAARAKVSLAQQQVRFEEVVPERGEEGCSSQEATVARLSALQPMLEPGGARVAGVPLPLPGVVPGSNGMPAAPAFIGDGGGVPGSAGGGEAPPVEGPGESKGRPIEQANVPQVAPVPESQAWAMMIVGFGLVGWMIRRARRRAFALSNPVSSAG
ncbi:hypothetical protein [Sandaracinobacteroides saxicola]|uniref:PEP-CTERM sorting domain-containing protein n=1 Tax=Sandaracinobacteroides saxicola TaxID=2759707 RepID=A0A7G5IGY6_9SPHN|nr:hypothetical protein [Sandaracinobacteroides saxicola]QMW22628.1 hypothetical protein H3309_15155 [Sandaracinobacteroides saxicola]